MLSSRSRPIWRAGAALVLAPALVATLLGASGARAASPTPHTQAQHTKAVHAHVVHARAALLAPTGHAVVTACTTAGLMAALSSGNVITFACNPATSVAKMGGKYVIVLPQTDSPAIPIGGGTLSIDGSDGGANDVAIDGGSTSATTGVQIFNGGDGSALTLSNLTVQNGFASRHHTPTTGSSDDGYGGAVETTGDFSATNVSFLNNKSYYKGGALELDSATTSSLSVVDTITNSTFRGNMSGLDGDNDESGGAIDIDDSDENGNPMMVTISHSTFDTNSTFNNTSFPFPNCCADGGAIFSNNGNPATVINIDHSLFTGNSAVASGGAIANNADTLNISDSQFTNNSSINNQGGALFDNDGPSHTTTVLRSSFVGNSAKHDEGGAIDNDGATETIANSTISGNSEASGGAIATDSSSPTTLIADTIAGNIIPATGSAGDPAGVDSFENVLTIQASIISNNVNLASGPTTVVNCDAAVTDNGYNLEYSAGSPNTCGFTPVNHDVTGVDPLLGAPADNGGPNIGAPGSVVGPLTMALGVGSPAIGIVTPAICAAPPVNDRDGRSLPRNSAARGGCDAGAYDTNLAGGLATTAVTNPIALTGAINALFGAGFRLGFAASTGTSSFPLAYITFQKGASSFVVRQPVLVSCIGQCLGVANDLIPNATATVTLTGEISTGRGAYLPDQTVVVTLTLMTGPRAALGTVPIAVTLSAVSVSVNAVPVASATGPFTLPSSFHAVLPAAM